MSLKHSLLPMQNALMLMATSSLASQQRITWDNLRMCQYIPQGSRTENIPAAQMDQKVIPKVHTNSGSLCDIAHMSTTYYKTLFYGD